LGHSRRGSLDTDARALPVLARGRRRRQLFAGPTLRCLATLRARLVSAQGPTVYKMSVFHIVVAQGQASVVAQFAPVATVTAALVAAAVALYLNTRGRKNAEGDRRRTLYSEAYRVALEWCEGIYRIRWPEPVKSNETVRVRI